jgi:hypothetical protein
MMEIEDMFFVQTLHHGEPNFEVWSEKWVVDPGKA